MSRHDAQGREPGYDPLAVATALPLVLGVTGPFGSGCSTVARLLEGEEFGFRLIRLSDVLRKAAPKEKKTTRSAMQDLGDALRLSEGLDVLARRALADEDTSTALVIDGIRNTGEIDYLRTAFGDRFFLIAVYAPAPVRWERVRSDYTSQGLDEQDFLKDDKRDENEETRHGQQVELCVDKADVFLRNSETLSPVERVGHLTEKLRQHVRLLTGEEPRYPSPEEVSMNLAFSSAHSTKCLKRQVGAVITSPTGEPISVGFNENPDSIKPCVFEFGECYRDRVRNDHFAQLAGKTVCPVCGDSIAEMVGPPWKCKKCAANLESFFFPDRAMKWCTALHAEERAIINAAGRDLSGAVIYTTAFPCFLCAEKIMQAGITRIVFADPYPDIYSAQLLDHARPRIEVERFEGVRSGIFDRIFGPIREVKEAEVDEKRRRAFDAASTSS